MRALECKEWCVRNVQGSEKVVVIIALVDCKRQGIFAEMGNSGDKVLNDSETGRCVRIAQKMKTWREYAL